MNQYRKDAFELRNAGYSYKMITERLGVPKSTLSNWLSGVPFTPNQELVERVGNAKLKSALQKHHLKLESIARAKRQAEGDIKELSERDLFMLGIALYLGEGGKTPELVRLVNSDPRVIRLAMRWFRVCCGVKMENFRATIHLYPDNSLEEARYFWPQQTGLSVNQFNKASIDRRENKSKFNKRKLPYGTLHLYVNSNNDENSGVHLHRKILSWIERCLS